MRTNTCPCCPWSRTGPWNTACPSRRTCLTPVRRSSVCLPPCMAGIRRTGRSSAPCWIWSTPTRRRSFGVCSRIHSWITWTAPWRSTAVSSRWNRKYRPFPRTFLVQTGFGRGRLRLLPKTLRSSLRLQRRS